MPKSEGPRSTAYPETNFLSVPQALGSNAGDLEVTLGEEKRMPLHIIEEAGRCLNRRRPLCQEGCPVHTPMPRVIEMFREREMDEAGSELYENNPMSVVCSLVCNHGSQCEGHCVRGRKGAPVHFSLIENYVSDTCLDRARPGKTRAAMARYRSRAALRP